jgi:hypothetical protein
VLPGWVGVVEPGSLVVGDVGEVEPGSLVVGEVGGAVVGSVVGSDVVGAVEVGLDDEGLEGVVEGVLGPLFAGWLLLVPSTRLPIVVPPPEDDPVSWAADLPSTASKPVSTPKPSTSVATQLTATVAQLIGRGGRPAPDCARAESEPATESTTVSGPTMVSAAPVSARGARSRAVS